MHAFLIVGQNTKDIQQNLKAKSLEFIIQKIDDVRELNKLLRLTFNEKTLIVIRNIEKASEEALNAFLKNLEEPQENIYFALTTPNISQVLPTIVSRCQIVKVRSTKYLIRSEFLDMIKMQKLEFVSKIKDRHEAIKFTENLMRYLQNNNDFDNLELILKTYTRLNANCNVNLQLSNLAINFK